MVEIQALLRQRKCCVAPTRRAEVNAGENHGINFKDPRCFRGVTSQPDPKWRAGAGAPNRKDWT